MRRKMAWCVLCLCVSMAMVGCAAHSDNSANLNSAAGPNVSAAPTTQPADRWTIGKTGGITWDAKNDKNRPHEDHIEMAGKQVAQVIFFGVDGTGRLILHREVIWPMLRTIPNDTRGEVARAYNQGFGPQIIVNGDYARDKVNRVTFDGVLTIQSSAGKLGITRTIVVPRNLPCVIDRYTLLNRDPKKTLSVIVSSSDFSETTPEVTSVYGKYIISAGVDHPGTVSLAPSQSYEFSFIISGRRADQPEITVDPAAEETGRRDFVADLGQSLVLETPDPVIDRMFALSKIRTSESIYATKAGLMHGPGGGLDADIPTRGRYYAAIWANDQAEYAGPFFPYEGNADANEASLNAYRIFARYMNPDYTSIPSSIVAEATNTWHGAGDRGDNAMIAYGASRYALARGDKKIAQELFPLVQWCLEYCHRKLTADGVVASDHDELEGRLPAGPANLHTSVLYYDALHCGADLVRALGMDESIATTYEEQAKTLRQSIDKYFAANVEGFNTYRYYDGDTVLRAWICSPLTAGIMEQKAGTIAALTSDRLWGPDGLTTASGREDFWDRSTLYALRGMFIANEPDLALKFMDIYSEHRLLGEHVPYAVEAYPEGNQSHLAAESALYARIVTEGMFGIRPTGLDSFDWTPSLPSSWPQMTLRHVEAFGADFTLDVKRASGGVALAVTSHGATASVTAPAGGTVHVKLGETISIN